MSAPTSIASSRLSRSGSMNTLTLILLSWHCEIAFLIFDFDAVISRPPSVVTSSLFSGTSVTRFGSTSQAIFTISSVAAISRFILVLITSRSNLTSLSLICLLSSLKWQTIPSAPASSHIPAAITGSGSEPPRATLTVATWSIFTASFIFLCF